MLEVNPILALAGIHDNRQTTVNDKATHKGNLSSYTYSTESSPQNCSKSFTLDSLEDLVIANTILSYLGVIQPRCN